MTAVSVTDFSQYAALRGGAEANDPAVLREVAGQFEALFVQTMLKNMRSAKLAEPMFGSDQHDLYLEMMDKQLAVEMSKGSGFGFADLLVQQLSATGPAPTAGEANGTQVLPPRAYPTRPAQEARWSTPQAFAADVWTHVQRAAARLDVPAEALVAQAALETGWGQKVMLQADGTNSYNLFGIKATAAWTGGTVVKDTLEFDGEVARQVKATFRAYPDVETAVDDYIEVVGGNPRYRSALGTGNDVTRFAEALQRAGYATDPVYAEKIDRLANGDTLRLALGGLKDISPRPINSMEGRNAPTR